MRGQVAVLREQLLRGGFCLVHQLKVAGEIRDLERGQTVLARAEKVTRTAQLQILLGDGKAVVGGGHRTQAVQIVVTRVVGDEDAVGFVSAAPDAPAQLVKLRKTEAFGVFNEHHGGVGHVHADLDDGGGNENVRFAGGEGAHDGLLFLRLHLAVEDPDAQVGENLGLQRLRVLSDGFSLVGKRIVLSDHRADDVRLPPFGGKTAQKGINALVVAALHGKGVDALARRRQLVHDGNIQIAVDHQRERARNGRCRHDEKMRVFPLLRQRRALADAEAVLLVRDDETERLIGDVGREQCVRADDKVDLA